MGLLARLKDLEELKQTTWATILTVKENISIG
jgi:hypothetical protein